MRYLKAIMNIHTLISSTLKAKLSKATLFTRFYEDTYSYDKEHLIRVLHK